MTSLATKLKDYTPMTQLKMHGEMTLDMNQETRWHQRKRL